MAARTPNMHYNSPSPSSQIRAYSPPDWEGYRDIISELYSNNELREVMRIMQEEHEFRATYVDWRIHPISPNTQTELHSIKQYKTQITKWGLDKKRIKASEYKAMLKVQRRREQQEPPKATQFFLHGREVPLGKISRFESRMVKEGKISEHDMFDDVGKSSASLRT